MKDKSKFFLLLLFIGSILLVSHLTGWHEKISTDDIREFIKSKGGWGPLFYFLLYIITSIFFFPSSVLSTTSGVIWGPVLGTIYTVSAATISAVIPFLIARYFGRRFMAHLIKKGTKAEACERFVSERGFLSVLVLRLIPVVPWDVINYGAGLCSLRFKHYILATFVGIIPGSLTYNLIGDSLGKPLDKSRILIIASVVVVVLGLSVIYHFRQRSIERNSKHPPKHS